MIVGVDPGGKGAIAYVDSHGELRDVYDMPMMVHRGKPVVDPQGLWAVYTSAPTDEPLEACYIERVWARPGESVTRSFTFGRRFEAPRCIFGAFMPVLDPTPAEWKKEIGIVPSHKAMPARLRKGDQEAQAVAWCVERWPSMAALFKRKKDGGRAEACCIAEFGRRDRSER